MSTSRNAKKDSPRTGRGKQKVDWRGYINWQPTAEDKARLEAMKQHNFKTDDLLEEAILDGYRFSWSWDDYNSSYTASLYCTDPENSNAGWCATMRGSTLVAALERVLFFHYVIANRDWDSVSSPAPNGDKW